jgi:hypothetical protein
MNHKGKTLFTTNAIAGIILALYLVSSLSASASVSDISAAIKWLVRTNHRHPLWRNSQARGEMAGWIVAAAREWQIDHMLLTGNAFLESTFRPGVTGTRGEVGLVQVGPHVRRGCERDEYDMAAPLDQLRCGARHLRRMIDRCGSLRGGLTAYASAPPRCREVTGDRVWRAVNIRMSKMRRLRERPWREK